MKPSASKISECKIRFVITMNHRITEILGYLRSYFHFYVIYYFRKDKSMKCVWDQINMSYLLLACICEEEFVYHGNVAF